MWGRKVAVNIRGVRSALAAALLIGFLSAPQMAWSVEVPISSRYGGDFSMPSSLGKEVNLESYRGKVVLINFGYTQCPNVCPTVLSSLGDYMDELGEMADDVQVLFVTLDPDRDTPEHLASYLTFFHPDFVGLSGTSSQVDTVTEQYGTSYVLELTDLPMRYGYAHSDDMFLVDQQGRFRKQFDIRKHRAELTESIKHLLNKDK